MVVLRSPGFWLAAIVIIGIANMAIGGAPSHYLAVNAAALGLALAAIGLMPSNSRRTFPLAIAVTAVIILILPLLIGPEVTGMRRWVGFGAVQLHSGMLALPVLAAVLLQLKPVNRLILIALAASAIAVQPDRASAMALFAASGAVVYANRSAVNAAQLLLAALAVLATFAQPDVLQPVRFVETILSDAARHHLAAAAMLIAILAATLILPALRYPDRAVAAAAVAGYAVASLIGAYPVPLLGYGASSILGFGLAIAAARRSVP